MLTGTKILIAMKKITLCALIAILAGASISLTGCEGMIKKVKSLVGMNEATDPTHLCVENLQGKWCVTNSDAYTTDLPTGFNAKVMFEFTDKTMVVNLDAEGPSLKEGLTHITYSTSFPHEYELKDNKLVIVPQKPLMTVGDLAVTEEMQHTLDAEGITIQDLKKSIEEKLADVDNYDTAQKEWLIDSFDGKKMNIVRSDGQVLQLERK